MSIGSGGASVVQMPVLLVLVVVPQNLWVLGQCCSREFKIGVRSCMKHQLQTAGQWERGGVRSRRSFAAES